jgi:hypothetical protein
MSAGGTVDLWPRRDMNGKGRVATTPNLEIPRHWVAFSQSRSTLNNGAREATNTSNHAWTLSPTRSLTSIIPSGNLFNRSL